MYYVLTNDMAREERYWTGGFTPAGLPATTSNLNHAHAFDGARAAYKAAGILADVAPSVELQSFRVGRRPTAMRLR